MKIYDNSTKILFLLIAFSIVSLIILCPLSIKYDFFGNNLKIDKAFICQELGDNREPLSVSSNIKHGARQVCLWFRYSSIQEENYIRISWYLNNELIFAEQHKLIDKEGIKAFYLLKEDGSPLIEGFYKVLISSPTRTLTEIPFIIKK